jgi:hypothetical protein
MLCEDLPCASIRACSPSLDCLDFPVLWLCSLGRWAALLRQLPLPVRRLGMQGLAAMSSQDMGTRSSAELPMGSIEADRDLSKGSSSMSERLTPTGPRDLPH